jgi:hypothetical protein
MEWMNEALQAVLIPVIIAVGGFVIAWFKKASANLQAKTDSVLIQGYIAEVERAITDAVAATNKTFVDVLKEDGAWSKEKGVQAMTKSLATAKRMLTEDAKNFIQTAYGDLTKYLEDRIEAKLKKNEVEEELAY